MVLANFLLGMLRTRGRDMCDVPQAMRQHEVVVELFVRGAATVPGRTGRTDNSHAATLQAVRDREDSLSRSHAGRRLGRPSRCACNRRRTGQWQVRPFRGVQGMKRAITILVILAVVGGIGWKVYQKLSTAKGRDAKKGPAAVAVEVAPVRQATIHESSQFTGDLTARSEFVVAPKVAGRLVKLLADIGDTVDQRPADRRAG